ncbi:MAG TPA: NUDIX domain-containing protein [Acidimicrobiales bacterium]|nr:NUDIX domain-containing protein [Acidimicrobiales bacterium]
MPKRSAGILPFKVLPDQSLEVLIVHPGGPFWKNKEDHAWSVVKGEHNLDETPEHAAEREFLEELGLPVPEGKRFDLGEVQQAGGKRVRVWAIEAEDVHIEDILSNRFEMEWPPNSGQRQSFPEIDRAEWVPLEQARGRLIKAQEEFLDRLLTVRFST